MSATSPAERAAQYAAQARSAHDARGSDKPEPPPDQPTGPPLQTPRDRWTVHHWGGTVVEVLVRPAQTQQAMRKLYPDAAGIVAL